MSEKIFIGYNNIAGVGLNLKEGFEESGYRADFYSAEKSLHKYNNIYKDTNKSIYLKWSEYKIIRYFQVISHLIKIIIKYKYFIYLIGSDGYFLSGYKDIKLLKFINKKVAVIFTGCDVRVPEAVKKYKWNPCVSCPDTYKKFVGCKLPEKYKRVENLERIFDYIFSPLECGGYIKKEFYDIKYPVRNPELQEKDINWKSRKIRILHAPSNEDYKGSKHIYSAIDKLQKTYNFEFVKVDNISKDELFLEILKSDLIIDQMLVGFYGNFAVESMLLEKPVVCYIRDDIWENIKDECPVYNANPDILYEVLEDILKNPEKLKERGRKSKEYALKYHSPENVARYIMSKLDEVH